MGASDKGSADGHNKSAEPSQTNDGMIESNWDEVIGSFDGLDLKEDLLRGIFAYGFEKPSAIQQRAIKPVILGRDVIAQAQSGTGKTATFAISILEKLDQNPGMPSLSSCSY